MTERTFVDTEKEYKNLQRAADILTTMEDSECYYIVRDCYFDYGQDWKWTTILKINPNETGILRSCQAINPKEWKLIVSAETKQELLDVMKSMIK